MKTIGVSEFIWEQLMDIKKKRGMSSLAQTILYLVVKEQAEIKKEGDHGLNGEHQ